MASESKGSGGYSVDRIPPKDMVGGSENDGRKYVTQSAFKHWTTRLMHNVANKVGCPNIVSSENFNKAAKFYAKPPEDAFVRLAMSEKLKDEDIRSNYNRGKFAFLANYDDTTQDGHLTMLPEGDMGTADLQIIEDLFDQSDSEMVLPLGKFTKQSERWRAAKIMAEFAKSESEERRFQFMEGSPVKIQSTPSKNAIASGNDKVSWLTKLDGSRVKFTLEQARDMLIWRTEYLSKGDIEINALSKSALKRKEQKHLTNEFNFFRPNVRQLLGCSKGTSA